jgi:hypothetical protein
MKKNISVQEIEEIIKNKLRQNGVLDIVGQEKVSEIKNKIKDILENGKKLQEVEAQNPIAAQPAPEKVQTSNPNITVKTTEDPEKTEIVKKETEIEIKQRELLQKEFELEQKEKELQQREKELSYRPEMPEVLKNIEPESIIVFSENELSLGSESLSNRKFRMKSDPDDKKSIHDLWLLSAITKANVYVVELKKIGDLIFNPYEGNATFENVTELLDLPKLDDEYEMNHNVEQAVQSQQPKEEMLDAIKPITDVSQPIMNVDELEKEKFHNNFKDAISKIVSDELNKISSQTTKKNIFSL